MNKTFNLDQIREIAGELLLEIKNESKEKASILALSGDLGAGKTTLTKEIALHLGVKENVISPTFVIMKKYKTKDDKFINLIHIDAYRLDKSRDILVLGWEEIISNKENLIILEWPEKIQDQLPLEIHNIRLEHEGDITRSIHKVFNLQD